MNKTTNAQNTLVVIQLTGGNDFMNTLVPYTNGHYYDARKKVVINQDSVLPINETLGINANAAPFKRLYDEGSMAIVQGIGYPNSNRSHFLRHGYLAYLRTQSSRERGLVGSSNQRFGSKDGKRAHGR